MCKVESAAMMSADLQVNTRPEVVGRASAPRFHIDPYPVARRKEVQIIKNKIVF